MGLSVCTGDFYSLLYRLAGQYDRDATARSDFGDVIDSFWCSVLLVVFEKTERRGCLFYTSDASDERSRVDSGGCRII